MKSKYDTADFKFIYENKVLTNSNNGNTDRKDPTLPYKELFWTSIRVSAFMLTTVVTTDHFIQHVTRFQNNSHTNEGYSSYATVIKT